jgi:hypothetical protein
MTPLGRDFFGVRACVDLTELEGLSRWPPGPRGRGAWTAMVARTARPKVILSGGKSMTGRLCAFARNLSKMTVSC